MAQKLWEKNVQVDHEVDIFTVGKDRELDLYLAKYDVLGSMAHITMLESIGLLTKEELNVLLAELRNIYAVADRGEFIIEEGKVFVDKMTVIENGFKAQCPDINANSNEKMAMAMQAKAGLEAQLKMMATPLQNVQPQQ